MILTRYVHLPTPAQEHEGDVPQSYDPPVGSLMALCAQHAWLCCEDSIQAPPPTQCGSDTRVGGGPVAGDLADAWSWNLSACVRHRFAIGQIILL
jgi:hypothetical protein